MGKRYLIDSNTLIEYIGKTLPEKGQSFVASVINILMPIKPMRIKVRIMDLNIIC
jgi:hypothetical protein